MKQRALFLTIPHSGEELPPEADWLRALPAATLYSDVDRFVDRLYLPACARFSIPAVIAKVHRYAVDLNRYPDDIDAASVQGAPLPAGTHPKGFHWVQSTRGQLLQPRPMSEELHQAWVHRYHDAFHAEVARVIEECCPGAGEVFHLDCHSMPSQGTAAHADAGQVRPDVVVSDFEGRSSRTDFVEWIEQAFSERGFRVARNWPYKGGRITQRYGKPEGGHHTVQIELNRALYMDESTLEPRSGDFERLCGALEQVLQRVCDWIDLQITNP